MTEEDRFVWPYTPSPGGATPPASTGRPEGRSEVVAFFWLALLNTLIIAAVGLGVWFLLHSPTR
jgi:hypothetical protein